AGDEFGIEFWNHSISKRRHCLEGVDETNPSSAKSNRKARTLEFNQGVRAELYFQLPDLG
ncbi:MAG: hypothetical protein NTV12_13005, partial [Verrucomicrobia bacterium]|nr:hypothetical protein [Verrucomicrobiota bacterium]